MRVTISDARESPLLALVFAAGVATAVLAVRYGDGDWGASPDEPLFWLGAAAAAVAIVVTVAVELRNS